ncbi:hypothetical protein H6F46_14245 [Limnothrix sp. FACHB-1083]|nr:MULTISPECIES: hypothetical protein [unclassified Limnothrix]MBD2161853.1 hypothetical protein [Limnothrix sp. FACHB-1083]MBD2192570.1 hypothetical protein [Limnothrix sp. FACHB-1088]
MKTHDRAGQVERLLSYYRDPIGRWTWPRAIAKAEFLWISLMAGRIDQGRDFEKQQDHGQKLSPAPIAQILNILLKVFYVVMNANAAIYQQLLRMDDFRL